MRLFVFVCLLAIAALFTFPPALTQSAVPARSVQPSETFDAGMLRVERFGDKTGRPLIFVPALFCGSWQWNGQVALLAKRYDIYVATLPGFDGRVRDARHALMERAVSSLSRLIHTRKLDRPIVIGHSLGGTIAVLFGEERPAEAGGIIAVEGGYPIAKTVASRRQQVARIAGPFERIDRRTFDRVLRANLRYIITSTKDVDAVAALAERSDPDAIADWMHAALILDLTPNLSKIRVPFTEIVPFDPNIDPYQGFASLEAKRKAYQAFVALAPRGRVIMIAPSRHFVMFDQPDRFNRALSSAILLELK